METGHVAIWVRLAAGVIVAVAVSGSAWATPVCSYTVVQDFPHDSTAYTQGLLFHGGFLYESTGVYGESSVRKVDLATGTVLQQHDLDPTLFGEGMTLINGRLVQITWMERIGFEYDLETFATLGTFAYDIDGWGLTDDGERLIVSDGSRRLYFWDPETHVEIGQVNVYDDLGPVMEINELEYVAGEVWANLYNLSNRIARIDPTSGEVIAWIDLTGLYAVPDFGHVLNGIAYIADGQRILVTGKQWTTVFEITLVGCPPLPVFADGFGPGATENWSEVVQGP